MRLDCPKCGTKLADFVEPSGLFRIYGASADNKKEVHRAKKRKSKIHCQLPVSVTCGKRGLLHDVVLNEGHFACACGSAIANQYAAQRHEGTWILLDLASIRNSALCSDARMMCLNRQCEEEMFLKEFLETGKTLGNVYTRSSDWNEYKPGDHKVYIRALDNPPQSNLDYEV